MAETVLDALARLHETLTALTVHVEFLRLDCARGFLLFDDEENLNSYRYVRPAKPWPTWMPAIIRVQDRQALYFAFDRWRDQQCTGPEERSELLEKLKLKAVSSLAGAEQPDAEVERMHKVLLTICGSKIPNPEETIICSIDDDLETVELLRLIDDLKEASSACECSLASADPSWLGHMDRSSGHPWRASILRDYIDRLDHWPRRQMISLEWLAYPRNAYELASMATLSNPVDSWTSICNGLREEIAAVSAARLEAQQPRSEHVPDEGVLPPYEVDVELPLITIGGLSHRVPAEAARMAKLLLDARGDWVAMSKHDFSKPSSTKKSLPRELRQLIETDKGKGYRLRRSS